MIVHKPSGKLLLNLNDPARVTTVIPTARTSVIKGHHIVSVPHMEDEVRVLRNLGFDPPAPIEHYYDWPGRHQPFAHQRTTSAFLTVNPWSFCLNGMGCIAGDERVRVSRKGKSYEIALRDLHRKFHALSDKDTWKCRSLLGDRFGLNMLEDVLSKGDKPTLRITLEDGKTFRCTADHRLAQPGGRWIDAGNLAVGDQLVTNGEITLACPRCGTPRVLKAKYVYGRQLTSACRSCKHAAQRAIMAGPNNPSWKGGKFTDSDGYVRLWYPDHHRADNNGYVYEHIVRAEVAFGVQVTPEFHVHHKNGVKHDNDPANLEVLPAAEHHRSHDPRLKLDGAISAKGGLVVVLPRSARVVSIEDGGVTDVYDLCMKGPHHNFVVNGVVVHNSGKTLSVLWAFDYLKKRAMARRMLVVAPLSTLVRTWADEVFSNMPHLTVAVLHGTMDRRLKLLDIPHDIYVVNHDGIKSKELLDALCKREDIDVLTVDELAAFRTAGTQRFKAMQRLVHERKYVWGLTGTPTPNAPTDAWAQCRLISPTKVPKYFGQFRDQVMKQVSQFKWVARDSALEIVKHAMQPAIRFSREDCIDLPPTIYQTHDVDLTPEQKRAFDDMVRTFRAEYAGGQVLAVNEAVKLGKLVQICCGVAYGPHGNEVVLPSSPRVELCRDLIEEADAKVIVFVPLTGALEHLARELAKTFTVEVVHGGTSKTERDRIFGAFQKHKDPHVLVANAGAMSHGLTLTAANTIIWYGPPTSNDTYIQANARIVRPGQKLSTLIVHIESTPIEARMFDRLRKKGSMQGALLDMLKGE